jgi:hypothetical protein
VALASRISGTLRFGSRAPLSAASTSAFVFGAAVSASWVPKAAPHGVEAVVRLDGFSRAGPGGVDRRVEAIVAAGVGLWVSIVPTTRLTADVLIGASTSPVSSRPATEGLALASSVGLQVAF